jgi:hypothetical protein
VSEKVAGAPIQMAALAARVFFTVGMLLAAASVGTILMIVDAYRGHLDSGDQAGAALGTFLLVSWCTPAVAAMLMSWLALDPAIDTNLGITRRPIVDPVGSPSVSPRWRGLLGAALLAMAIVVLLFSAAILAVSVRPISAGRPILDARLLHNVGYLMAYTGSLLLFAAILYAAARAMWRRTLFVSPATLILGGLWEIACAILFITTVDTSGGHPINLWQWGEFSPPLVLGGLMLGIGIPAVLRRASLRPR